MTEKHYRVVYKVIMDSMESEEQALAEAVKSIRANLHNCMEKEFMEYLKLEEISDEDANDGRV